MTNWASGGGTKIERAKEHIAEFETASRAFLEANPYFGIGHFDEERRAVRFTISGPASIPPRLSSVAADAVQNLRAALDILCHVTFADRGQGRRKGDYFPMFENAQAFEARFKGVKKASHKAAVNILRQAKPYKAGNKPLYDLFEIAPRDRHETPVLSVAAYQKIVVKFPPNLTVQGQRGVEVHFVPKGAGGRPVHVFLKNGAPLPWSVNANTLDGQPVVDMKCELPADIAFGEGEILEGQPVLKTLHEFLDVTDAIVSAFLLDPVLQPILTS